MVLVILILSHRLVLRILALLRYPYVVVRAQINAPVRVRRVDSNARAQVLERMRTRR